MFHIICNYDEYKIIGQVESVGQLYDVQKWIKISNFLWPNSFIMTYVIINKFGHIMVCLENFIQYVTLYDWPGLIVSASLFLFVFLTNMVQSLNLKWFTQNIFYFIIYEKNILRMTKYHRSFIPFQGRWNVAELAFWQLANILAAAPHITNIFGRLPPYLQILHLFLISNPPLYSTSLQDSRCQFVEQKLMLNSSFGCDKIHNNHG